MTKRIIDVGHEDTALHVDYRVGNACSRGALIDADSGCALRIVGRTKYAPRWTVRFVDCRVEVVDDLTLVPHVIARGEHVDSKVEKFLDQLWSHTESARRIFDVGDRQIYFVFGNELRKMFAD